MSGIIDLQKENFSIPTRVTLWLTLSIPCLDNHSIAIRKNSIVSRCHIYLKFSFCSESTMRSPGRNVCHVWCCARVSLLRPFSASGRSTLFPKKSCRIPFFLMSKQRNWRKQRDQLNDIWRCERRRLQNALRRGQFLVKQNDIAENYRTSCEWSSDEPTQLSSLRVFIEHARLAPN